MSPSASSTPHQIGGHETNPETFNGNPEPSAATGRCRDETGSTLSSSQGEGILAAVAALFQSGWHPRDYRQATRRQGGNGHDAAMGVARDRSGRPAAPTGGVASRDARFCRCAHRGRRAKINALPIRFLELRSQAKAFRHQADDRPGWLAGLPMAVKDYNDVAGQLTTAARRSTRTIAHRRTIEPSRPCGRTGRSPWQVQCAGICGKPYVQSGMGRHPQSLEPGTHRRGLLGRRRCRARRARGLAGQWLVSRRVAADTCEFLWRRRTAAQPGVVARGDGLPAFDSLWVEGPMARTVSDLALMLDAMATLNPHDPLSRAAPAGGFQTAMRQAVRRDASASAPTSGCAA